MPTDHLGTATPGSPITSFPNLFNLGTITKRNYVREYIPQIATTNSSNISLANQSTYPSIVSTKYTDGLGRPLQDVERCAVSVANGLSSFTNRDLVVPYTYNAAGLPQYQYLPFSVNDQTTGNAGKLKTSPMSSVSAQYNTLYQGERPYVANVYDNTPLNRLIKQIEPGYVSTGPEYKYGVYEFVSNLPINEPVIKFQFHHSSNLPTLNNYYATGDLLRHTSKDADGKTVVVYIDKSGKTILTKQLESITGSNYNYAETYYVYDDFERLRYVITPLAVKNILASGISNDILSGLCYYYGYDDRGRIVEKRVPGKEIEYLIYDNADRLVAIQDGNNRANNQWNFTVYDCLDRPLVTGITTSGLISTSDWNNVLYPTTTSTYATNDIRYYLTKSDLFNEYPATTGISNAKPYNYNFYDDYSNAALSGKSFISLYNSKLTGTTPYCKLPSEYKDARGQLTGKMINIPDPITAALPSSSWLTTAMFYDENGRLIQTQEQNHVGGINYTTTQYDFAGDIASTHQRIDNPKAVSPIPAEPGLMYVTNIVKNYGKDYYAGIVKVIDQSINGYPFSNIYKLQFDELGRVSNKTLGSTLSENRLTYNIRNWLNGINKNEFNSTTPSIFFREKLFYDQDMGINLTSGNISGIKWQGYGSAAPIRAYGFEYDKMGRLTNAEFGQFDSRLNAPWGDYDNSIVDYAASGITYDYNGNIKTMIQRGPGVSTPVDMDILRYKYTANTNQLYSVADLASVSSANPDFKDNNLNPNPSPSINPSTPDYTYDANGNITKDVNKGINEIGYTYLNKPVNINVTGKGSVSYTYDALGNKLNKVVVDNSVSSSTTVTDYVGPLVFENNVLKFITHEEGRARVKPYASPYPDEPAPPDYNYDYFVKDHLGNVRSVVTSELVPWSGYYTDHEVAMANHDRAIFANIDDVRDNTPISTSPYDLMAAQLEGNNPTRQVGTAVMLRVMAGDKFELGVNTFFETALPENDDIVSGTTLFGSLASTLLGGSTYEGVPISELSENTAIINSALTNPANASIYEQLINDNTDSTIPAAHLTYLLFDEQFNLVAENSGAIQFGSVPGTWNVIGTNGQVEVAQNGYVVAYISSRSKLRYVWGDKFTLKMFRGKLLEENHYYPFGLTLSSQSANPAEHNDMLYNSKELQRKEFTDAIGNKSGLEVYDYGARMMDPQLGRWWQVDPHAGSYFSKSPYSYALNNPVLYNDLDGRDAVKVVSSGVITIKAVVYVQANNGLGKTPSVFPYNAKEMIGLNSISDILNSANYKVTEGEYAGYTVKFDIEFIPVCSEVSYANRQMASRHPKYGGHSIVNTLKRVDQYKDARFKPTSSKFNGTNSTVAGYTVASNTVIMNKDLESIRHVIHEMFHTFFFDNDDATEGIGKYFDSKDTDMPNQNDINMLINNPNLPTINEQTLGSNTNSPAEEQSTGSSTKENNDSKGRDSSPKQSDGVGKRQYDCPN